MMNVHGSDEKQPTNPMTLDFVCVCFSLFEGRIGSGIRSPLLCLSSGLICANKCVVNVHGCGEKHSTDLVFDDVTLFCSFCACLFEGDTCSS